jgi:gamma-glutamyltranspeptidase / glutathione hydrolase
LKNPDMAATLERVAQHGVDDFYSGSIARRIAEDMRAHGGLISLEDLAKAVPETNEPLWGTYRGLKISTNRPPGGGVMVLEMLNILEQFDLKAMGHNSPDYIATVAEAMKIATVDKDAKVGDPRFVDVPLAELISKDYAAPLAARIKRGEKTHVPRLRSGAKESADTTHVCAVDENGVCATMTHTLGTPSGVVTEGLGFMYNGAMAVFDPRPGRAGSLAPGKSRFSSMAPSILFKDGKPFLVLGAPGGTYIAMGILQAILNVVEFGMNALEAVSAPRFNATSDTIDITNRILRSTEAELKSRGYSVRRWPLTFHFAGVHAIRIVDGKLDGGADPGRDGMAMAV